MHADTRLADFDAEARVCPTRKFLLEDSVGVHVQSKRQFYRYSNFWSGSFQSRRCSVDSDKTRIRTPREWSMINMYVYLPIVTSIIRFWVGYAVGGFVVKKRFLHQKWISDVRFWEKARGCWWCGFVCWLKYKEEYAEQFYFLVIDVTVFFLWT